MRFAITARSGRFCQYGSYEILPNDEIFDGQKQAIVAWTLTKVFTTLFIRSAY